MAYMHPCNCCGPSALPAHAKLTSMLVVYCTRLVNNTCSACHASRRSCCLAKPSPCVPLYVAVSASSRDAAARWLAIEFSTQEGACVLRVASAWKVSNAVSTCITGTCAGLLMDKRAHWIADRELQSLVTHVVDRKRVRYLHSLQTHYVSEVCQGCADLSCCSRNAGFCHRPTDVKLPAFEAAVAFIS